MSKGNSLLVGIIETADPTICQVKLYEADGSHIYQEVATRTINGSDLRLDTREALFFKEGRLLALSWIKQDNPGSTIIVDKSLASLLTVAGGSYARSNLVITGEPNTLYDGLYHYASVRLYPQSYIEVIESGGVSFVYHGYGDGTDYEYLTEPFSTGSLNGKRWLFGGSVIPSAGNTTTEDCPIFVDGDSRQYRTGEIENLNPKIKVTWSAFTALPIPATTIVAFERLGDSVFAAAGSNGRLYFLNFDRTTLTFSLVYTLIVSTQPILHMKQSYMKKYLAVSYYDGAYKTRVYKLKGGYASISEYTEEAGIGELLDWTGNDRYLVDLGQQKAISVSLSAGNVVLTDASTIIAGIPSSVAQAISPHSPLVSLHGYTYNEGNRRIMTNTLDLSNMRIYLLTEDATFFTTDTLAQVTNSGAYVVENDGIPSGGILLENVMFQRNTRTGNYELRADEFFLKPTGAKTFGQMLLFDATNNIPVVLFDFSSNISMAPGDRVQFDLSELLILE